MTEHPEIGLIETTIKLVRVYGEVTGHAPTHVIMSKDVITTLQNGDVIAHYTKDDLEDDCEARQSFIAGLPIIPLEDYYDLILPITLVEPWIPTKRTNDGEKT